MDTVLFNKLLSYAKENPVDTTQESKDKIQYLLALTSQDAARQLSERKIQQALVQRSYIEEKENHRMSASAWAQYDELYNELFFPSPNIKDCF